MRPIKKSFVRLRSQFHVRFEDGVGRNIFDQRGSCVVDGAVGADVFGACAVAGDIGISYGCDGSEFDGNFDADVLAERKYALPVFHAVAGISACDHGGFRAAFGDRLPCFCERGDGYGDADGRKLVSHGGTSLIFIHGN